MKQPEDTLTLELPLEAPKRRGRPPKHGEAMSAAERQKAYRSRVKRGALFAVSAPDSVSTPALLAEVARLLSVIRDENETGQHDACRRLAEHHMRLLAQRHGLKV